MYWVKYLFFVLFTLPVAIFFEQISGWLPSWLHMGYASGFPVFGLVILACAGRFADAASTVLALESPLLVEGAPSLGSSPSGRTLLTLAICQVVFILIAGVLLYDWYLLRILLLLIVLVSFAATISNLLLLGGSKSVEKDVRSRNPFYPIRIGDDRDLDDLSFFNVVDLKVTELGSTLIAIPLSALLAVLICNHLIFTIIGALGILFLYLATLLR